MISSDEIRRFAGFQKMDPMIVEKDYILGCYLHFICKNSDVKKNWVFKGGTCLKKCYFEKYRFSEDLDFTVRKAFSKEELTNIIQNINLWVQDETGIRFDVREFVIEVIEDDYGKESFEARIYYRGPWQYRGSPPAIRIHVNRDEVLYFPQEKLPIFHSYSDKKDLPGTYIIAYSLEEILAEKLRAFSGQRKYTVSRDIYDIFHLHSAMEELSKTLAGFEAKCAVKGISLAGIDIESISKRQAEFKENWQNNLEYLVPENLHIAFDDAWKVSINLLGQAIKH